MNDSHATVVTKYFAKITILFLECDVTDSKHKKIFTFISPEKLKKQDKFQPRDRSYL